MDARPFRAQLRYLMASGSLTVDDVAAVAGISAQVAERLLHGRDGGRCVGSVLTPRVA